MCAIEFFAHCYCIKGDYFYSRPCYAGGMDFFMAKNIYVGNLSYGTSDDDLKNMFVEFGSVENAKIIVDRETGRSKGFGFVEIADDAASAAIEALDGKEIDGRNIKVNEARPREERPRRGGGGGGGRY